MDLGGRMATDGWPTAKLGDVVANHDSRRIPLSSRERATRQGRYPYYGAAGVIDFVDRPIFSGLHLLVGEDGSVVREDGRPFLQLADGEFWVNNHAHVLTGDTDVETRFIYYALSNTNIRGWVTGAVQPKLNQGNMNQIEIPFPDEGVRRAIVSVLGTLDDKIEVNRKQARVLEGIARAVFNSWFVDFDPVRRKAAGEPTGLPDEIAALFPDRLVDSPMGEVPEGWTAGTVGDIADSAREGVDPGDVDSSTPYIGLEHMPRRSIALTDWAHAGKVTSGKSVFRRGQILFGKLRPYFHKVGVAPVDGVCSTDIIVAEPKKPCWSSLALGHLSSDAVVQHADRSSSGTKMPRANWRDLAAYQIAIPPEPLAALASDTVAPMIDRIVAGIHQNRALGALRDTLLPKLISGELRIADAEQIVGRAD